MLKKMLFEDLMKGMIGDTPLDDFEVTQELVFLLEGFSKQYDKEHNIK